MSVYHLLATACLDPYPVHNRGGCVAHLTSTDLSSWDVQEPLLLLGLPDVPECPDYCFWNGWYYLIFDYGRTTRYRMSREPFGSWCRPKADTFDGSAAYVMRTAAFTGGRRIGAAWIGTRVAHMDTCSLQFGGHLVFRELIQAADGTLDTRFAAKMIPRTGSALPREFTRLTEHVVTEPSQGRLQAENGVEIAMLEGVPLNTRITMRVRLEAASASSAHV